MLTVSASAHEQVDVGADGNVAQVAIRACEGHHEAAKGAVHGDGLASLFVVSVDLRARAPGKSENAGGASGLGPGMTYLSIHDIVKVIRNTAVTRLVEAPGITLGGGGGGVELVGLGGGGVLLERRGELEGELLPLCDGPDVSGNVDGQVHLERWRGRDDSRH